MVRVGRERDARALASPHVSPCRSGKRTMPGFVQVASEGLSTARNLRRWLKHGRDHLAALQSQGRK